MLRTAAFLGLFAVAAPSGAGDRLAMRLTPAVAVEPGVLTVQALVEADPENRALAIFARSADFYRSSWIELNGERAQRLNIFQFKNLPIGMYEITSVLVGEAGERAAVTGVFRVAPATGSR
jgi:hypothetical protein